MSRAIDDSNYRIVISGDDQVKPQSLHIEYIVVDGDMKEPPQRLNAVEPDFSASINDLFSAATSAVTSDAEL